VHLAAVVRVGGPPDQAARQSEAFLAGVDPTKAPEED